MRVFSVPFKKAENARELAITIPLLIMIFWIGLYPTPFFDLMGASVEQLTASLDTVTAIAGK